VAWLESLGGFHANSKNWAEAAMCFVHIAALIAEYLNLLEPSPGLPQGASAFRQVSFNAVEESSLSDISPVLLVLFDMSDVMQDEEGICESHIFTEAGLLKMASIAFHYLKQVHLSVT
jgi:hypothetical protein